MSAAVAAAAAAALANRRNSTSASTASATTTAKYNYNSYTNLHLPLSSVLPPRRRLNRYELQKQEDWDAFGQYLKNHHNHRNPPVSMWRCSGAHVVEFLQYLDQFGETKVHNHSCMFFGQAYAPAACPCPLKQAWSSLDALVSRLRAAFEEHGGSPQANPFGSPAVWLYLREVKESQAEARGIAYG